MKIIIFDSFRLRSPIVAFKYNGKKLPNLHYVGKNPIDLNVFHSAAIHKKSFDCVQVKWKNIFSILALSYKFINARLNIFNHVLCPAQVQCIKNCYTRMCFNIFWEFYSFYTESMISRLLVHRKWNFFLLKCIWTFVF